MPELSKHELDKLFQQGSERYNFDYNPAAWEQMAAMLDRRRRRRVLWWWIFGLATLLLLGGLAYCFFRPDEQAVAAAGERGAPTEAGSMSPARAEMNLDANGPDSSILLRQRQKPAVERPAGPLLEAGRPEAEAPPPPTIALPSPPTGDRPHPDVARAPSATSQPIAEEPQTRAAATIPAGAERTEREAWREAPQLPSLPLSALESTGAGSTAPGIPPAALAEPPLPLKKGRNHLAIGPAFGAGLHSVGWGDFSKSGWKAGVYAEYRYNGRFALGLGASFLRMHYLAGKGEYMPPYGFWAMMAAPDNTLGLCHILEVPVSVKYYFGGYNGNGFYVGAGLSSYVLLMEEYWYRYAVEEPGLTRWWQTRENQSHWLAIGEVSAGYQAAIGERTSLLIGPYLQAPLAGVGHGQVELYSLGVNVQLLWSVW